MENFSTIALNGGEVYVLDAEETELLHVNYQFTKIHENKLVQFRFDGIRPIAGTDMYDVGTCRINGKQGTILCTKENIIAAQSSVLEPLIKTEQEAAATTAQPRAIALTEASDLAKASTPRRGAFSGYVFN